MVIVKLTKKDILFGIRWAINTWCVISILIFLVCEYFYDVVRLLEPNKTLLFFEIMVLILGIILNIHRFREYLGE